MAEQDAKNALINSFMDQELRNAVSPMLVGLANKDSFDLEDVNVDSDTNIYVDDINQVKPIPINGISNGGIALLNIVNKGIEEDSTDSVQGGRSGSGATAREIVISNERAEELKGQVYIMLKALWLQKYRLRIPNLLMNLTRKKIRTYVGEGGAKVIEETYQTFRNKNAKLSDGSLGVKQIEVVDEFEPQSMLNRREEKLKKEGQKVEIVQVTSDYLDEWEYEIELTTQSFHQKSRSLDMAISDEKIGGVAKLFPDIFKANKDKFFEMWMEKYGDNPEEFLRAMNQAPTAMPMGIPGMEGQPAVPAQAGAPALPTLSGT